MKWNFCKLVFYWFRPFSIRFISNILGNINLLVIIILKDFIFGHLDLQTNIVPLTCLIEGLRVRLMSGNFWIFSTCCNTGWVKLKVDAKCDINQGR